MAKKRLTTAFGAPVADDLNSVTAGERGPVLMQDVHLLEKLAHFDRERIPERVVHAKGAGAYGYFEVTADVTKYTKAKFLSKIGKRTDVFLRFSTVGGEKGSPDAARDPRGFALKFYTEEGNYDLVGNNTPVFFIRDPLKFPDFIHTQKRNPATNLPDPDMFWDFLSLTPESIHQVTVLFSDRGTPASYRYMNGYSSHTFKWYNAKSEYFWVQYHFKTDQGIKNLTREEAGKLCSSDPDHATRDLYEAIARKAAPENSYQRDAFMRTDNNGGGGPNYWPNSFDGPGPDAKAAEPAFDLSGKAGRHPFKHPNDDFVQAGNLYRNAMTETDRKNLVGNIVGHLGNAKKRLQMRQAAIFYKADTDYGTRVAKGLGLDIKEVKRLAGLSQDERAKATVEGSYK